MYKYGCNGYNWKWIVSIDYQRVKQAMVMLLMIDIKIKQFYSLQHNTYQLH